MTPEQAEELLLALEAILAHLDAIQALQIQCLYSVFVFIGAVISAALVYWLSRIFPW